MSDAHPRIALMRGVEVFSALPLMRSSHALCMLCLRPQTPLQ